MLLLRSALVLTTFVSLAPLKGQQGSFAWSGMPRWSVEVLGYAPVGSTKHRIDPSLTRGYSAGLGMPLRAGVAYRFHDGFYATVALERTILRSGGVQNNVIDSTWTSGDWFTTTYQAYHADELTIGHTVNSICLGIAARTSPVERGRVACRAELRAGLRVLQVAASFGSYRTSGVYKDGWFSGEIWDAVADGELAVATWESRNEVAEQQALGLAADGGFRLYVHLGQHFSVILPDLQFSVPVIKPNFGPVDAGEVRFAAHKLDMAYGTIGGGVVVHW